MSGTAAAWVCALPLLVSGAQLAPLGEWTPGHERVSAALRGEGLTAPVRHAEVVALLAGCGGEVLVPLLDIAAGRAHPAVLGDDAPAQPPVVSAQRVAVDVLQAVASSVALDAVSAWCGEEPGLFDVLEGIRFSAAIDDPRALEGMLALLAKIDAVHLQRPFVRVQVVAALKVAVVRDERSIWFLTRASETLTPQQLGLVVELQGGVHGMEGVKLLRGMLDLDPELDRAVVEALGVLSVRETESLRGECIDLLRSQLHSPVVIVGGAAALSLARLGDHASIPAIVDMLEAADPIVAFGAERALRELAGHLPSGATGWSAGNWSDWYLRELDWFERNTRRLAAIVQQAGPAQSIEALRELVAHPLFRRESADLVEELLRHDSDELALAACRTLAQLGWVGALDGLTAALDHANAKVRTAAHASLCALSGEQLAADADEWRSWLGL